MIFLLKHTFKNLWGEINHSLEEILIFEYHFTLSMTEQNTHVNITYLFTFLLQMIGLIS